MKMGVIGRTIVLGEMVSDYIKRNNTCQTKTLPFEMAIKNIIISHLRLLLFLVNIFALFHGGDEGHRPFSGNT